MRPITIQKNALFALLLIACIVIVGCQTQTSQPQNPVCGSTPVCGADLKIYPSDCDAQLAGIKIIAQNKCPTSITQAIEFVVDGSSLPVQYIQKDTVYEIRIINKLSERIILNVPSLNAMQSVAPGTSVRTTFTPRQIGEHAVYVNNNEVTKIIIR